MEKRNDIVLTITGTYNNISSLLNRGSTLMKCVQNLKIQKPEDNLQIPIKVNPQYYLYFLKYFPSKFFI